MDTQCVVVCECVTICEANAKTSLGNQKNDDDVKLKMKQKLPNSRAKMHYSQQRLTHTYRLTTLYTYICVYVPRKTNAQPTNLASDCRFCSSGCCCCSFCCILIAQIKMQLSAYILLIAGFMLFSMYNKNIKNYNSVYNNMCCICVLFCGSCMGITRRLNF